MSGSDGVSNVSIGGVYVLCLIAAAAYLAGALLPVLEVQVAWVKESVNAFNGIGDGDATSIAVLVAVVLNFASLAVRNKPAIIVASVVSLGAAGYLLFASKPEIGIRYELTPQVGAYLMAGSAIALLVCAFLLRVRR